MTCYTNARLGAGLLARSDSGAPMNKRSSRGPVKRVLER